MGDRANYVIRESGRVDLFYSHWGAVTVAEDVFWGPARTEAFIRSNAPETEWLDDVWSQGGIALDKDTRRLTYYYFEWPDEEDVRRVYESLLEETWRASGWTVQRAVTWQEVAAAVGVDPALVTSKPVPFTIEFDRLGQNLARSFCCSLLSVRTGEEGWHDHAIDFLLSAVLMNGQALIDRLPAIADLEALRAAFVRRREEDDAVTLGDWINSFCAIDIPSRTLRVSEKHESNHAFLQDAWPGWTILFDESGDAAQHFAFTGRHMPADFVRTPAPLPPAPPNRSYAECVRLIREHIDGTNAQKSGDWASRMELLQKLNQEEGPVTAAPGFLQRVPSSQPTVLERIRLALRILARKLKA